MRFYVREYTNTSERHKPHKLTPDFTSKTTKCRMSFCDRNILSQPTRNGQIRNSKLVQKVYNNNISNI